MNKISPISKDKGDKSPLYIHIYEQLFNLIESNYFKLGEKLPGENALAKKLGVSRPTLRQALLILQEDGIIHNIQGKGNFIVKNKKHIDIGLERLCNEIKIFNNDKYDDINLDIKFELPTKVVQSLLHIKNNDLVAVFSRVYKINSINVCYNVCIIPHEIFSLYNLNIEDKNEILSFLEEKIYEDAATSRMNIRLTRAGDYIGERLNISEGEMLFFMEENMFRESGEPIVLNKSYFRPEFYDFHINRRSY